MSAVPHDVSPDWRLTAIETYREIEAEAWLPADLRARCREHREALEAEPTIRWGGEAEPCG